MLGVVIFGVLLWAGELVANAQSGGEAYGLAAQGAWGAGGWMTALVVGAVVF